MPRHEVKKIHPLKEFQLKVTDCFEVLSTYWIVPCVAKNITTQRITRERDARVIVELKIMNQQYSHYIIIKKGTESEYLIGQYLEYLQKPEEEQDTRFSTFQTYVIPKNHFAVYFGPVEISTGNELKDKLMRMGDYSEKILSSIPITEYDVIDQNVISYRKAVVVVGEGDNYHIAHLTDGVDHYRHYIVSGKTRVMQTSIFLDGDRLVDIGINTKFDSMRLEDIITKAMSFARYAPSSESSYTS